jgi:hypothetical protein
LPAARNKGRRDHLVPLSQAAVDVIDNLPKGGPFVFSVNDNASPMPDARGQRSSSIAKCGQWDKG